MPRLVSRTTYSGRIPIRGLKFVRHARDGRFIYAKGGRHYVIDRDGINWIVEVHEGGCDC